MPNLKTLKALARLMEQHNIAVLEVEGIKIQMRPFPKPLTDQLVKETIATPNEDVLDLWSALPTEDTE